MSYFHPWTLRQSDSDDHVKYAGALRSDEETWRDAMQTWLDGNVLCQEAKQYICNFFAVHRMRPRDDDDEDDCNSQDVVSDEELEISKASLADALATRIGGKEGQDTDTTDKGPSHFQNSAAAVELNQNRWNSVLDNQDAQIPTFLEPKELDEVLAAAKQSQKR